MDRFFRALLLVAAAHRFAIDGDDLGGRLGQRRHPIDKAPLERAGVERGENIAQRVMGRRAIRERAKPPQQVDLLRAEPGDVGETIGVGEHRQKTEQQHLVERINHLAGLPTIRHVIEIIQKNNRFAKRPGFCRGSFHHRSPPIESVDSNRFSTSL